MKNLIQSIFILIAVVMSTTVAQEVIYAQVGGTVRLPKPKNIEDGHYVFWNFREKNGPRLARYNRFIRYVTQEDLPDEWKNKLTFDADSLVISNIQQENFGTVVREVRGKVIDTITYKIIKINVPLNPPLLLPGESLTLTCDAEITQGQKPRIHWLNPENTRAGHGGTVTESAKNQHNGQWTCVLTNNEKQSKAKVSVTVIDLSPAPSSSQYTSKSSSVTIPCSRPPNIPWKQFKTKGLKRVQWRFFPKPSSSPEGPQTLMDLGVGELMNWTGPTHRKLTASNLNDGNLSLINTQTTEEHGGDYECCLTFENGRNLTRTIRVEVLKIISSGTFISGQQVNLNCSTGYALPPDVRLQWIPPPSSSQQKSSHHSYIIPKVSTGDSGKWKCELWRNTTRLTSTTIILKIESNLSGWMLVTICGAAVIVILTCILVLILHRRRQRKMRHLRHRVCRCKNPKPKGFQRS
ncbi:CD4-1 molecule [Thunnus maccoyii]|uniref:CD4-1 molecule n=1 Tax=Thunnus maccoyii TaxID=8240 RepID=UPI001C4CFA93|nr:CD4-1 molecule [Thunnus maccoyii]